MESARQPSLAEAMNRLWTRFLPQIEERVAVLGAAAARSPSGASTLNSGNRQAPRHTSWPACWAHLGWLKAPSWPVRQKNFYSSEPEIDAATVQDVWLRSQCSSGPCSAVEASNRADLQQLHSSLVTPHDPSARQLDLAFEAQQSARRIWPVRELVEQVRELVEQKYIDVWVEGEISNFRPAPSGHIYFTLKDAEAQLPVVLFRRQALLLRFRPEDGLHVLVRGRVSVYEQRGQLQLVAETMEPVGAGSLQLAFEQLKERLKAEGLFDADRKRPLPGFPRTVGIVTSPTGAVIRDFLNIVGRRHSGLNVLLFPVSVQGDSAAAEIESALAELNASGLVDVIVLARGGGSLEDLAAFNSERVARAIVASRLAGCLRRGTRN